MSDFRDHLEKSLSNPAFKAEWENQSVERDIMRQIVEARIAEGLSQQELAAKCGMKPSNLFDISFFADTLVNCMYRFTSPV